MLPQRLLLAAERIEAGQEDQAEGEEQDLGREGIEGNQTAACVAETCPLLADPVFVTQEGWKGGMAIGLEARKLTRTQVLAAAVLVEECWTSACSFLNCSSRDLQQSKADSPSAAPGGGGVSLAGSAPCPEPGSSRLSRGLHHYGGARSRSLFDPRAGK